LKAKWLFAWVMSLISTNQTIHHPQIGDFYWMTVSVNFLIEFNGYTTYSCNSLPVWPPHAPPSEWVFKPEPHTVHRELRLDGLYRRSFSRLIEVPGRSARRIRATIENLRPTPTLFMIFADTAMSPELRDHRTVFYIRRRSADANSRRLGSGLVARLQFSPIGSVNKQSRRTTGRSCGAGGN